MQVIHKYTRKQAIEDGQQFNTDNLSKGLAKEAGIKWPVYITLPVKNIIEESLKYGANDINGVLWDIFTMFKHALKQPTEYKSVFKVIIYWKSNSQKNFSFYSEIGATDFDNPDPAITIMTKEGC